MEDKEREYSDELYHYGRKGMKWYQNIFTEGKNRAAKIKKKKNLEKARQAKVEKAKAAAERKKLLDEGKIPVKDMTDDEINRQLARMDLEKKYTDAMKNANLRTKSGKGQAFVMDVVEKSGKNIATQLVTYGMGKAVNKAFENMTGDKSIVNPKKGQKDK